MTAVLFEVTSLYGKEAQYFDISDSLADAFDDIEGFISVNDSKIFRHQARYSHCLFSTTIQLPGTARRRWLAGRRWDAIARRSRSTSSPAVWSLEDYRLRIASVVRDYTMGEDG